MTINDALQAVEREIDSSKRTLQVNLGHVSKYLGDNLLVDSYVLAYLKARLASEIVENSLLRRQLEDTARIISTASNRS